MSADFLDVVTLAVDAHPQAQEAIKAIVAREWGEPGIDLDREWRIGEAITDALHLSIGHPGGGQPEDVRWEYTILLNLIYHVPDYALGAHYMRKYGPDETP
jgi:hypothetical protein